MNKNYRTGRTFEYETIETWEEQGYTASRTAGSHGPYDVIAFRPDRVPELIQCKRTTSKATAKRLIEKFKFETTPSLFYNQVVSIKIKGTKAPLTYTV